MSGRTVLVTGVSRDLGRTCARSLANDPAVERVIGVDVMPPRGDIGDVQFVRADIRNPVIAKVIAREEVDTVVHMSVIATPGTAGARGTMKELNVIGTMQLLAACQKAESLRSLVVKSGGGICSPRPPAEPAPPARPARPLSGPMTAAARSSSVAYRLRLVSRPRELEVFIGRGPRVPSQITAAPVMSFPAKSMCPARGASSPCPDG